MTHIKRKLLGLCVVVFGLMVFDATAAMATSGAKWLVLTAGGSLMSEAEVEKGEMSVTLEAETTFVLHSKIAGVAALFECKKLEAVKAFLLASGSIGESKGNVKGSKGRFSGCITKLNGATSAACEPKAGGKENGVIVTNAVHALLELQELGGGIQRGHRPDFPRQHWWEPCHA